MLLLGLLCFLDWFCEVPSSDPGNDGSKRAVIEAVTSRPWAGATQKAGSDPKRPGPKRPVETPKGSVVTPSIVTPSSGPKRPQKARSDPKRPGIVTPVVTPKSVMTAGLHLCMLTSVGPLGLGCSEKQLDWRRLGQRSLVNCLCKMRGTKGHCGIEALQYTEAKLRTLQCACGWYSQGKMQPRSLTTFWSPSTQVKVV